MHFCLYYSLINFYFSVCLTQKMGLKSYFILILVLMCGTMDKASAQCMFQSPFRGTTWHDNTKGTLTFTDSTMTGWNFDSYGTTVNSWQCLDNSTANYLIMRSIGVVTFGGSSFYAYLCLKYTSITDYSYYYYQMFHEQQNAGMERVKFDPSAVLTATDACDTTVTPADAEFHVLVQSGSEANAAVTCPESLLFSGDYLYLNNDGSFDCNGTTDIMDFCSTTSEVTFNYTICSQQIAYSSTGSFYCVASLTLGGYDYAVLYNRDTAVTVTDRSSNAVLDHNTATTRFSCLTTDGATASVSPHNCTSYQTPSGYPTLADMTTVNGYLLVFNGTKYVTCPTTTATTTTQAPSGGGGLGGGAVAAIVIVIILLVVAVGVIIAIYLYLRSRKNKVTEMEKPMLARNGIQPRVETIDETSRGNKILRERSTLSKDGTVLPKERSTLSREGTLTSMKREKSNLSVTGPSKKAGKVEESVEARPFLGLSFLSFCPCKSGGGKSILNTCRKGICPCMKDGDKSILAILPCVKGSEPPKETGKEDAEIKGKEQPLSKGPAVKATKKGVKDKKGGKASSDKAKPGKGGKDKTKKNQSSNETQTDKSALKSKEKLTKSDIIIVNTPRPGSPSKGVETITTDPIEKDKVDNKDKSPKASKKKQEKSKLLREKTDVSAVSSVRRPGTVLSLSGIDSTIKDSTLKTEQNGITPPKAKKKSKILDWNFLVCLQGNRSPEPQEEPIKEAVPKPEPIKTSPRKPTKGKGGKGKKGDKKAGVKEGKKAGGKSDKSGETEKKEIELSPRHDTEKKNLGKDTDTKEPDSGSGIKSSNKTESPSVERSKTLPLRREETTVTLQDGKIAVDVYVPDETTTLTLKDTVRVVKDKKEKGGIKTITKSKTTLGTTRPDSSKETGAKSKTVKSDEKKTKTKSETTDKSKKQDDSKTGSKLGKSEEKKSGGAKKKKKKK